MWLPHLMVLNAIHNATDESRTSSPREHLVLCPAPCITMERHTSCGPKRLMVGRTWRSRLRDNVDSRFGWHGIPCRRPRAPGTPAGQTRSRTGRLVTDWQPPTPISRLLGVLLALRHWRRRRWYRSNRRNWPCTSGTIMGVDAPPIHGPGSDLRNPEGHLLRRARTGRRAFPFSGLTGKV